MLYPIGYKDGEVVLNIGYTKTLSTYSFSQNPANTVVTEVDVPEFVEYIRDNILTDNFITKVTFHEGLKVIGYRSFRKNKINEINFPNTLITIEKHAFAYNLLEELVIPDSIGYIGSYAFEYNKLKKVKLGKGLRAICNHTFLGNEIENLTFSDNILEIGCSNCDYVKVLNLIDIDFKYFRYFTKKLKYNFDNLKRINIKFKHELTYLEKLEFSMYKNTIYNNIIIDNEYKEETLKNTEDKEINDLVKEIQDFLSNYSVNVAAIKTIINELITRYKNNISFSKPKLDLEDSMSIKLTLDNKNIKITRLELIKKLQDILLTLYEKKDLFLFLEKLDGYLNNTIDDEITNKIKNIYNIGDILEDNTLVNKITSIINKTKKDIENNILGAIKTGISENYTNNFEIEINNLYEEYQELFNKVKPYIELVNILESNSNEARISKDILDLELVISTLDKNSKEKFSVLLEDIKTYFINLLKENINKIRDNEGYISLIDIELLVRKRLDVLLQDLANTNYMSILFNDLDDHVNDALKYLVDNELSTYSSITSIIGDIFKVIEKFNESEKASIINKLQKILLNYKMALNDKDEYNKLINKYKGEHQDMMLPNDISILELILLNELMNILLNVQEYKNDLEEYTSLSNKSVNRL